MWAEVLLQLVVVLQVATHVQKYFIKLANAGLPVPGRMPNLASYPKKKVSSQRVSAGPPDWWPQSSTDQSRCYFTL